MQSNRSVDTAPELALRRAVHALGLRFRVNHAIALDRLRVRPDMVFTARHVCVFLDGCFWHRCPEHASDPKANSDYWTQKLTRNVERDRRVDHELRDAGWTVIRVWEHEDPEKAALRVELAVRARAAASPARRPT
jgi:DNA mismatch endonuclease (patch repair protein)